MTQEKSIFIKSFFKFLEDEQYVLLKWLREDLSLLPDHSDLDILLSESLVEKLDNYFRKATNIDLLSREVGAGVYHYYLYFKNGDFLQIDLLHQLVRKEWTYLRTKDIFENVEIINGIKTYTKEKLWEHVLLFNYLNYSGLPEKYNRYFSQLSKEEQVQLVESFNEKYGTAFSSVQDTITYHALFRTKIVQYLNTRPENSLLRKTINIRKQLHALWQSINNGQGKIMTFTGVDGAGKSTIIRELTRLLKCKYRKKVVVLRHRPSLLPILSAWRYGKEVAEQKSIERLPRQGTNNNKLASYLRFGYYYMDYLFGQSYIWFKYVARGYVVVYDRYYFDFIVDGKRSNITIPSWMPKKMYALIAKPDFNFFLYADVATILKRKQELSPSVIQSLTAQYKSLFKDFSKKHSGQYLSIENKNLDLTLQTIFNQLTAKNVL